MADYTLPLLICFAYLILFFLRRRIYKRLPDRIKEPVAQVYSGCTLRFNNLWSSIMIPVILINIIYLIMFCIIGIETIPPDNELTGYISSAVFVPFSEELIMRGLFFGFMFVALPAYIFRLKEREFPLFLRLVIISIGITGTSLLFVFQHYTVNYLRYFSGMLFCILYLYDKRNLTPAIVAHSTGNIIINFVTGC